MSAASTASRAGLAVKGRTRLSGWGYAVVFRAWYTRRPRSQTSMAGYSLAESKISAAAGTSKSLSAAMALMPTK